MPIYNVEVELKFIIVVDAEDAKDARCVAKDNWINAVRDADYNPSMQVVGEVTNEKQLRDGWDGMCLPYGGDGDTRLRELLTPNAELNGERSESAQT